MRCRGSANWVGLEAASETGNTYMNGCKGNDVIVQTQSREIRHCIIRIRTFLVRKTSGLRHLN